MCYSSVCLVRLRKIATILNRNSVSAKMWTGYNRQIQIRNVTLGWGGWHHSDCCTFRFIPSCYVFRPFTTTIIRQGENRSTKKKCCRGDHRSVVKSRPPLEYCTMVRVLCLAWIGTVDEKLLLEITCLVKCWVWFCVRGVIKMIICPFCTKKAMLALT
jgi:hypothetical protein